MPDCQSVGHFRGAFELSLLKSKIGSFDLIYSLELKHNYYLIQVLLLGGILTAEEGKRIGLVTEVIKGSCSMIII